MSCKITNFHSLLDLTERPGISLIIKITPFFFIHIYQTHFSIHRSISSQQSCLLKNFVFLMRHTFPLIKNPFSSQEGRYVIIFTTKHTHTHWQTISFMVKKKCFVDKIHLQHTVKIALYCQSACPEPLTKGRKEGKLLHRLLHGL